MTDHFESPLAPAEMLALAERERRDAMTRFSPDDRLLYVVWGVAWAVGSLARWLTAGADRVINAPLASGWIYGCLLGVAAIITALHIRRRVGGIHGRSAEIGRMHGISWALAFGAYGLIMSGLGRSNIEYEVGVLMASALPVFIVGLMYMAGAALWDDRLQFVLGAWLTLVAGASVVVGFPGHYLVLAIGGGGGFLVGAAVAARRTPAP